MLARAKTSALIGIEAQSVDVEAHVRDGDNKFAIIGLGDSAVKEARDRIVTALRSLGFELPRQILINLAPAELRKEGAGFDLAMAIAVLTASGFICAERLSGTMLHGELSLDGSVKPIRGAVALAIDALRVGADVIVVPMANVSEAALIDGLSVVGVSSLGETIEYLKDGVIPERRHFPRAAIQRSHRRISEVRGQESAKRALQVAAAGGHNVLMIGPPGCGKSMLAERFPSILPEMTREELLEVVKIHSVSGLPVSGLFEGQRPFRSPHHSISDAGLIGGGATPRPGEISLAHHGVLFLDEFPEFRRSAIESLRSPLEAGQVRVARAKGSALFPANFQLLAAMNPCPCGRLGSQSAPCLCSRQVISSYLRKLSQPILDRIDLHVELQAVPITLMTSAPVEQSGLFERWTEEIIEARQRQTDRGSLNARLTGQEFDRELKIKPSALKLLEQAARKSGLSARVFVRTLKVSMTIANLDGRDQVLEQDVAEAISYRCLERLQAWCSGESAVSRHS
jgi:magnesium chelatase family protein